MRPRRRWGCSSGQFVKKNATKIIVINLSDIKPVPIGTAAAMSFLWDPSPHMATPPAAAEQNFLSGWLAAQYGAAAAAALLPVTTAYVMLGLYGILN